MKKIFVEEKPFLKIMAVHDLKDKFQPRRRKQICPAGKSLAHYVSIEFFKQTIF